MSWKWPFSILACCIFFQMSLPLLSQNAPVTTVATLSGALPGTINVPVTVTNFTNIGAVSLALDYNYSILQYDQGIPNPIFPTMASGDFDLGNGNHRISIGWYGGNTSLPAGSTLITLSFSYIAGTSQLTWFDNGPSCEYVGESGNVLNDTPTSTYYINGLVCGGLQVPGLISGANSVCQGQTGVTYTVDPIPGVTSYHWNVPPGAAIINGNASNSITVDFSVVAVNGSITVCGVNECGNGPASTLPVTVNLLPIANAGMDVTIPYGTSTTLHASSGGTGTFSYHWSPENLLINPDIQNPQTVVLTSTTIFTLVVTNVSSSCQNSDEVIVSITGGPLSINPIAIPDTICREETSQLYASAGGGSGLYTYSWSCTPPDTPPWTSILPNPVVSPDFSKEYHLTVSDGYSSVSDSTSLFIHQLPTAMISGGDSLCDDGSVATIVITLTGSPPWTFIYSDGINSNTISNVTVSPYVFSTSSAGLYTVVYIEDSHCAGNSSGSAEVKVFPIPSTAVISQEDNVIHSDICCGNQWYKDNVIIPGATNQSYTAVADGNYFDIVTQNSCSSDTSNVLNVIVIGLTHEFLSNASVFPNPASDKIQFDIPGCSDQTILVKIFQGNGMMIAQKKLKLMSNGFYQMNIQELVPGSYIFQILSSHCSGQFILMVQH